MPAFALILIRNPLVFNRHRFANFPPGAEVNNYWKNEIFYMTLYMIELYRRALIEGDGGGVGGGHGLFARREIVVSH